MTDRDCVHRFLFEQSQIRGQVATLSKSLETALSNKDYPPVLAALLGQALTAVALLADTIKIDGSLILQLQGDGVIDTLVAQATDQGELRGLVHWDGQSIRSADYQDLIGKGRLVMTIDGEDNQRYQGVVEIEGRSLAESIEAYFMQSEQLATRLWLGCDGNGAGGLLLQQMPEATSLSNDWDHLVTLASTLTDQELVQLAGADVIHRLFHQEQKKVFAPTGLVFRCSCSKQKIEAVLLQLGEDEIMQIAEQEGSVTVDCEFCNFSYAFDTVDISALFRATASVSTVTH